MDHATPEEMFKKTSENSVDETTFKIWYELMFKDAFSRGFQAACRKNEKEN